MSKNPRQFSSSSSLVTATNEKSLGICYLIGMYDMSQVGLFPTALVIDLN